MLEMNRLWFIQAEFMQIYDMQDEVVTALATILDDLDIGEVQDLIE